MTKITTPGTADRQLWLEIFSAAPKQEESKSKESQERDRGLRNWVGQAERSRIDVDELGADRIIRDRQREGSVQNRGGPEPNEIDEIAPVVEGLDSECEIEGTRAWHLVDRDPSQLNLRQGW